MPAPFKTIQEAFYKYVSTGSVDDCWEWQGPIHKTGYGVVSFGGKHLKAHRVSWELKNGPIPKGKSVLHSCDNRKCVNHKHLSVGTLSDNNHDRDVRGRHWTHVGEKCGASRLTEEQVLQIRKLYQPHVMGAHRLAKKFGVSKPTILRVVHRKNWKHI